MNKDKTVYKEGKVSVWLSVYYPHLDFTVKFMDMSQLVGEKWGAGFTAQENENTGLVFIEDINKNSKDINWMPIFAHEIMHIIQMICDMGRFNIAQEQEHTAYIMTHLLKEIINK